MTPQGFALIVDWLPLSDRIRTQDVSLGIIETFVTTGDGKR